MEYLLSFEGRINRAKLWAFVLISIVWLILIAVIIVVGFDWSEFGRSVETQIDLGPHAADWRALVWPSLEPIGSTVALALILLLVFVFYWANLAVMIKRLHDRDKSGWWLLLYWLAPSLLTWWPRISMMVDGPNPDTAATMLIGSLIAFGIHLWVFIELFCLRGTPGTNRYGTDPLSSLRYYMT